MISFFLIRKHVYDERDKIFKIQSDKRNVNQEFYIYKNSLSKIREKDIPR